MTKIIKNKYGFFEVKNKPSRDELSSFYSKKYYQNPTGQYQNNYSNEEIKYFSNKAKVALKTITRINSSAKSLFEIGCGEGFFADYLFKNNISDLELNDFSDFGLKTFHPHLIKFLKKLDVYDHINQVYNTNKCFDIISMDNVLEHVIDPELLLRNLMNLMHEKSVIRITVPNDFSSFQDMLLRKGMSEETWINPPEHLSYFNSVNLVKFCEALGFRVYSAQCDFPIEIFLTNENTHYYKNSVLGKSAHKSRIICTDFLINEDIDSFIALSEAAAKLQFGRDVTVYLGLQNSF
jgi:2-polyprenyl-3-methyl-5-hydroxy-6-metoxy-1,4-benzoquinol methylase